MDLQVDARNHAPATGAFLNGNGAVRVPIESAPKFTSEHGERLRAERKESVRRLHERGLVPLAIADTLGWSDARVARYLNELEAEGVITRPATWLTLHGPKRGPKCTCCGRSG
jgi:DNA invertase Pin-like site-specific DNA recombinase